MRAWHRHATSVLLRQRAFLCLSAEGDTHASTTWAPSIHHSNQDTLSEGMACTKSAARRHVIYVKAANNKGNNSTEALLTDSGCLAHAMTPLIKTTITPLDEVDPVQELNVSITSTKADNQPPTAADKK